MIQHANKVAGIWLLFAYVAVCSLGCGDAVPAKTDPTSQSTLIPTGSIENEVPSTTVPPLVLNLDTKSNAATPLPAQSADAEPQANILPVEEIASSSPPTTQDPNGVEPVVVVPQLPSPTESQLARWKQVEFEPLQLLARHPTEDLSFVSQAVHAPGGNWLALGGEKLTVWRPLVNEPIAMLWDLRMQGTSESIKSLAIDPSGSWIAAGDGVGTLRLWSLRDQKEIISKKVGNNDIVNIAISDDGTEIATATYGKSITVWNTKTLELKKKFDVDTNGREALMYAGPGKLAVAGKSLTIWDTSSGTLVKTLLEEGYFASMARSSDRSLFMFAEENKFHFLQSNDLSDAGEWQGVFARNEILSPTADGKFLWTANGTSIRGWDLQSGQVVQIIDVNKPEVVGLDWIEKNKLLRVVTDDGTTCYWGTVANGIASDLKPLHAPIEIAAGHDAPATAFELQAMMDLRSLPKPPDSISTSGQMEMMQIDSGNSIDDTKAFYRHVLGQRGWVEVPGNEATPNYLTFSKNKFKVFISISDSGDGRNSIYLTSLGNVDLRTLPKLQLPGFLITYESDSSVSYEVESDLLTIETDLLKSFSASGWIPYARLNSSHNDDPHSRGLEFIRNAITIRVRVEPKPDDRAKYLVQYSAFLATSHLPVPTDCDFIECDALRSPALVVQTSLSLEDCHAFYDQAMMKHGWLVARVSKSKEDDLRWLTYFRNQIEVSFQLTRVKGGGTWIIVGEYAQQNSWQLKKTETVSEDAKEMNASGLQAADVPIFKASDTTSVNYDNQQKRIEIKLPKNSHVEIVDFYASKLLPLGWKEEPNGFRDEDYAFVTFTKDKVSMEVRVNSNSLGTMIGISADELMWDKAPPESKNVISYESWMRKNNHLASLKMLDEYVKAMRSITAD